MIRTKVNNDHVHTFQYCGKWYTMAEIKKERFTKEGLDLYEAGQNHLHFVELMRLENEG